MVTPSYVTPLPAACDPIQRTPNCCTWRETWRANAARAITESTTQNITKTARIQAELSSIELSSTCRNRHGTDRPTLLHATDNGLCLSMVFFLEFRDRFLFLEGPR
jgi:hypothetical protein